MHPKFLLFFSFVQQLQKPASAGYGSHSTRPIKPAPPASSLLTFRLLLLRPHRLPPHKIARERKQHRINRAPRQQNPKVQPYSRMEIEERAPGRLDDIVQRPCITPVIPFGREVEAVEGRGDVGDDPEDEPERRPGLADGHGDVLARHAEGDHADEVDGPVDDEGGLAVGVRVVGDGGVGGGVVGEGDLEGEGDEGVGEGHEEVGDYGADPAHDDELPEFDGRVRTARGDELGVDGHEEGEAEEGDDDEVDEADGDGGSGDGRGEGAETVH